MDLGEALTVATFLIEQVGATKMISGREILCLGRAEFEARLSYDMDALIFQIRGYVAKTEWEPVTEVAFFHVPDSPWQHFKQKYFPAWLLIRTPVKQRTLVAKLTCTPKAYYTNLPENVWANAGHPPVLKFHSSGIRKSGETA